jgi:hypothetical protein
MQQVMFAGGPIAGMKPSTGEKTQNFSKQHGLAGTKC